MYSIEQNLVFEWLKFPEDMRELIKEQYMVDARFNNDTFVEYFSEWSDDWSEFTKKSIEDWFKDEMENYPIDEQDTLEKFISYNGLEFDWWLAGLELDFTGIKRVLIKISW